MGSIDCEPVKKHIVLKCQAVILSYSAAEILDDIVERELKKSGRSL